MHDLFRRHPYSIRVLRPTAAFPDCEWRCYSNLRLLKSTVAAYRASCITANVQPEYEVRVYDQERRTWSPFEDITLGDPS
jgi:hypothetical protein